jgi:hypothetical protein
MNRKRRLVIWALALGLVLTLASPYWSKGVAAYRAAYPSDPLQAHALADCARMNSQFNRFWMPDRTMCYERQRLAK